MKCFFSLILLIILLSCGSSKKNPIKDDRFTVYPPLSGLNNNLQILVSSGQSLPGIAFNRGGFDFQAAFKNGDTVYLESSDTRFKIPEGYGTGDKFENLPEHARTNLIKEPGWGYYYTFPSGWAIGFCTGNSCTDNIPGGGAKIRWIFWRK